MAEAAGLSTGMPVCKTSINSNPGVLLSSECPPIPITPSTEPRLASMPLRSSEAMPIEIDDDQDHSGYHVNLKNDLLDAFANFEEGRSVPLIRNALSLWLRHRDEGIHSMDEPALLCDTFGHHYPDVDEEGFSEESLVGHDLEIVDCLTALTTELPFEIYLASLTKEEDGELAFHYGQESSDDDDDEDKDWHSFDSVNDPKNVRTETRIFTVDGSELSLENDEALYEMMHANMVNQGSCGDPFEDAEQWEIDLDATWRAPPGSRRGMDPPTATHCYRSAMFILVPRDEVDAFLLGKVSKDRAVGLLSKYIADCSFPEERASALKTLAFLARTLWCWPYSYNPNPNSAHPELGSLLVTAALKYLSYGLFNTVLRLLSSRLDPIEVLLQVRLATFQPTFQFKRISNSLLEYLRLTEISAGCRALTSISADLAAAPKIREWVTGTASPAYMERCRTSSVGSLDGTELVRLIQAYHDMDYFKHTFVPVLLLKARSSPFILAAMHEFAHAMPQQDRESYAQHMAIWTTLASAAIASFNMPVLLRSPENHRLDTRHLSDLLTRCAAPNFVARLTEHASRANSFNSSTFWLPLLQAILPASPAHHPLALAILTRYLTSVVGPAPTPTDPPNHRRPAVHCLDRCSDCQKLNAFLESNVQRHITFAPKEKNREHFFRDALKGCQGCVVTRIKRVNGAGDGFTAEKRERTFEARQATWQEKVRGAKGVMAWEGARDVLGGGEYERIIRSWGRVGL